MATTTYKWIISQMNEYPTTADNLTDVVFTVHWRRQAEQIDGDKTWFAETYGAQSVPPPTPENFTPYADLTQAIVEGWLENALDVVAIDASLDGKIENQKNPPVVSLPLPWNSGSMA